MGRLYGLTLALCCVVGFVVGQDIPTSDNDGDKCYIHISGGTEVCFYDPLYPGFECTNTTNKYPSYPSCRLRGACYTPMADNSEVCYYLHGYGYQCYFEYQEEILANMTNCNDLKANSPPEIRITTGGQPHIEVDEDVLTLADWISITDADAVQSEIDGDGYIRISFGVTNGYIGFVPSLLTIPAERTAAENALNPANGVENTATFESGKNGSLTDSLAFTIRTGPLADLMKSLAFVTAENFNEGGGDSVITIHVDDRGNTGGTPEIADDTVNVKANAVNDPPVITMPASFTTDEDVDLVLSNIDFDDVDINEGTGNHKIEIVATITGSGTLSYTGSINDCGQATCIDLSGGDKILTVRGSLTQVNTIVDTLTYHPAADFFGTADIQIDADDLGNHGTDLHGTTDTLTRTITVNEINDKPVITVGTVDGKYSIDEDENLQIFGLTTVTDVDHTSGLNLTLTVTSGVLTKGAPDAQAGTTLTFVDYTIAEINQVFVDTFYQGNSNFNGEDTLTIIVSDPNESASLDVTITIEAVNDPPELNLECGVGIPCVGPVAIGGSPASVTFGSAAASSATSPYIFFVDLDAQATDIVQLLVSVDEGTLTLPAGSFGNAVYTIPEGIADGGDPGSVDTIMLLAPKDDINTMLTGLVYTHSGSFPDRLHVTINDLGRIGKGEVGSSFVQIDFTA